MSGNVGKRWYLVVNVGYGLEKSVNGGKCRKRREKVGKGGKRREKEGKVKLDMQGRCHLAYKRVEGVHRIKEGVA
jgi:hypothetical protein